MTPVISDEETGLNPARPPRLARSLASLATFSAGTGSPLGLGAHRTRDLGRRALNCESQPWDSPRRVSARGPAKQAAFALEHKAGRARPLPFLPAPPY